MRALGAGLAALVLVAGAAAWVGATRRVAARTGLFTIAAVDYGYYWAQGVVFREGPRSAIYDLDRQARSRLKLIRAFAPPPRPRRVYRGQTPYPAVFAFLFSPLTRLPLLAGYGLWLALLGAAAAALAVQAARLNPGPVQPWAAALLLLSYPIALTLFLGQVHLILAWAVGACFVNLTQGRDVRAGAWLGLLALKPHYALLLGPALCLARRFRAVAAAIATGLAILAASWLIAGTEAMLAYPRAALWMGHWEPAGERLMMTWQALVHFLRPEVDEVTMRRFTLPLGLLAAALALIPWGRRLPADAASPSRVSLVISATCLVNTHIYPYGAAVLALPLAALWPRARFVTRAAVVLLALVPAAAFLLLAYDPRSHVLHALRAGAETTLLLHLALFACLLYEVAADRALPSPSPSSAHQMGTAAVPAARDAGDGARSPSRREREGSS